MRTRQQCAKSAGLAALIRAFLRTVNAVTIDFTTVLKILIRYSRYLGYLSKRRCQGETFYSKIQVLLYLKKAIGRYLPLPMRKAYEKNNYFNGTWFIKFHTVSVYIQS